MGSEAGAQALHHGAGVGAPSEVPLLPRVLSLLRAALGREGPPPQGLRHSWEEVSTDNPHPRKVCSRGTRPPPTPTTAPLVRGRPVRSPRATRSPASTRNSGADQPLSCPLKADSGTLRGAEEQPRLGSLRTRASEQAGPGRAAPQVSGHCGALEVAVRGSGGAALPSAGCRLSTLSGPRVCQDCCRGPLELEGPPATGCGALPHRTRGCAGSRAWLCLWAPVPSREYGSKGVGSPKRGPARPTAAFSPCLLVCSATCPSCLGYEGFRDTRL